MQLQGGFPPACAHCVPLFWSGKSRSKRCLGLCPRLSPSLLLPLSLSCLLACLGYGLPGKPWPIGLPPWRADSLSSSTQSEEEHGRTPLRARARPGCLKSVQTLLDEAGGFELYTPNALKLYNTPGLVD